MGQHQNQISNKYRVRHLLLHFLFLKDEYLEKPVQLVFIRQQLTLSVTACAKTCYMCGEVIARHVVFSSPPYFLLSHVLTQGSKNAPVSLT